MRSRARRLSPQPWPWIGARRVLVEHPDESRGMALVSALREAGYAVALCPGPTESERCPLLDCEGCAVTEGADAVVSCLDFDEAEAREVLRALRLQRPSTPVVVGSSAEPAESSSSLLKADAVVSDGAPRRVVAAVHEVLAGNDPEGADGA